ncbi:NAD(P)/FAD-dependent oxidoreductase [Dactylosporangium sp. AC04546]|uniref:dihydrolipoyl dehydrogenase family protein n=1 Tax=Dactylosporangium sp. AC04546 TaxID=2862460 RepID=UPI001EDD67E9|nr:NAD(P)/FAD-dependent oxidoreductase [Dactylosporangium sp. AC04546]WVK88987.1 NAD(P)/FAD-dependent oxidoreductase [Dactylosporangium sp. AC04546]
MKKSFDVVVIGTGEAGSTTATQCRAAGRNVAIVDSRPYGGTCGLRGCDPKKVLVGAAEIIDRRSRMEGRGVAGDLRIDWPELIRFKATFTDPFPRQQEEGFVKEGVETFHGRARFVDERSIEVGQDVLEGTNLVVATGAWPRKLGIPGEEHLTRSDQFLDLQELPRRIVFVGGGYIAFEFGHIAARAGATVTILQRGDRPLKHFDPDLVARLLVRTHDVGIDVRTGTQVMGVEGAPGNFRVTAATDSGSEVFEVDMVVHAAGRAPEMDDLDLPTAGVEFDRHGVRVDEHLRSVSNPAVYAAGDAANSGGLPETPFAEYEGGLVAENLLNGNQRTANYRGRASVVYSIPALGAVGMTEQEARAEGLSFDVKQADTSSWYSARRVAEPASMFKVLIEKGSGRILGAHLLGPEADEFSNLFALAIRADIRADALRDALFVYPTQASNMASMV